MYVIAFTFFALLNNSCVKEDLSKISSDFNWKAALSLPVSSITMNSENYRGGISLISMYNMIGMVIYTETIDFNLSDIFIESEYVDSLLFRLDIHNDFPAEIEVFAYYMNDKGQIVRNVISDNSLTIDRPTIDDEGNITKSNQIIHDERFTKTDIPDLLETKQILLRVFIRDMDLRPEVVNKIDDFDINISVGLRSSVNIPLDEI